MLPSDQSDPDRNLFVKFYINPVKNNVKSEEAGRPIFEDVEFISIVSPADSTSKIDRKASEKDRDRFHRQYAAFKRGESEKIEGTPLEEWAQLTRSQVEEMRYQGFRVVEQVAAANDSQVQKMGPGGYGLREKAKAFVAYAKDTAKAQKDAEENAHLKQQIEDLRQQIADLSAKFVSADAPKRGRPRKTEQLEAAA